MSDIRGKGYRAGTKGRRFRSVRAVAFCTADVITPVLAATEVVVILFCCVTAQTSVGDRLGVHPFEGSDLHLVAARIDVFLSRAVACFASDDLSFPGSERVKPSVLCAFKLFELSVVTRGTRFRSYVVVTGRGRSRRRLSVTAGMLRHCSECQPSN